MCTHVLVAWRMSGIDGDLFDSARVCPFASLKVTLEEDGGIQGSGRNVFVVGRCLESRVRRFASRSGSTAGRSCGNVLAAGRRQRFA